MERFMKDFDVEPKNPSHEAQMRWRKAAWLVKNPRRRFRYVVDLAKREESRKTRRSIQEKIRIAVNVHKAAQTFLEVANAAGKDHIKPSPSQEVLDGRFSIDPDDLALIVSQRDLARLEADGGVEGIARGISVSLTEGISTSEVSTRQMIYGSNEHTKTAGKNFCKFVSEAFSDYTLIILVVCAVISIAVGIATDGFPKGLYDGLGILLSIVLVVVITATSDFRQSVQFRELTAENKKISILVIRDGRKQRVSIHELVVGDIVELGIGDIVPADGIYISGYGLEIDESSLSGESEPSHIHEKAPIVQAGTKVIDGLGKMMVTAVGKRTEWTKLIDLLTKEGQNETPLQVKLNGVATLIGKIGLGAALLTLIVLLGRFFVSKWLEGQITQWSLTDAATLVDYFAIAVTILVVAVPEGLPLAVTLSLAFAMQKLMKYKALVRRLSACETMGSASSICTDKTGTLTTNHMVVDRVWMSGSAKDIRHETEDELLGLDIRETNMNLLMEVIFLNTGCDMSKDEVGKPKLLGSPTEKAIVEFGLRLGGDFHLQRKQYQIIKVEPFNSVRKRMLTMVALPSGGFRAFCKGAAEVVLRMCDKVVMEGEQVPLSEEQMDDISNSINGFSNDALRTLSLAFIDIEDTSGGQAFPDYGYTLAGIVGIKDPLRPGVTEAVKTCLSAGITVRMVTGDNINTAKAIARECGILTQDGIAIEGQDFRSLSDNELKKIAPKIQVMARSSPSDKHKLVATLRNMKEVVAVTGDGTNDAPALFESDIGFAMGIEGTEVAKDAADVIIMDDNFLTIVHVAKWGRSVYINIQKFVQFQLTVNIVALAINFLSACFTGSAPLTAVQLLWVNLIMDTLGALALATEPPNDALMKRAPVRKGDNFITKIMWKNIIGESSYQLIILGLLYFDGIRLLGLSGSDVSETLDTFIFNAFVFCQVFNEINSRDMEKINVFRGLFSNMIFLGIIAATVVFQVIIVEYLGVFANTVPLSWQLWVLSVAIGAGSLPVGILLKVIPVEFNRSDGYQPLPSGPDMA